MAKVGYARVSTVGQKLDIQLDKLSSCDKIFQEKKSGASDPRPQLKACLDYIREGDILIGTRLDRLALSTLHLCKIADIIDSKNVALQVVDQNIDTTDATGRLLFNMLASIAQFENEIRAERQMEGIFKAKQKGVAFGRKKLLNKADVASLKNDRNNGLLITDIMRKYRLSKATVYRYLTER
ncbi:MAG: recombinase family protein [Alphaproteobacteria bacterium]